jgi:hypothetical protein
MHSSSRKIFYSILVVFLLIISFLITGVLASEYYEGEKSDAFPDRQIDIWNNLISVDTIPDRKPNIERVMVIEENRDSSVWREILKNGQTRTFRISEKDFPNSFVIERIQSDDGLTGRWEYYLFQNQETKLTEVYIKEYSINTSITLRAWYTILGRSINLRREMKSLRVSLFRRLLTTP